MFPACQASDYLRPDKKGRCSAVNIAKCYQNIDINLDDSSVDNLVVKQKVPGCKSRFSKKRNSRGGDSNSDSSEGDSSDDIDDKVPKGETDYTTQIVLFLLFVAVTYVLFIEPSSDQSDEQKKNINTIDMIFVDLFIIYLFPYSDHEPS